VTLKLVSNIAELPVTNYADIAAMARKFADELEAGEHGTLHRAVLICQADDTSLSIHGWGESTSAYEMMGLFEAAKLNVFADQLVDD
jgi:hypothetical protein